MAVQLYAISLMAQGSAITDSLARLLLVTRPDTARAMLYYQLGDEWSLQDGAKGLQYVQAGIVLAKRHPFYEGIGHFFRGRILMESDHAGAMTAFDKGLRLLEQYDTKISYLYQSRSWANKAAIAQRNSDNQQFIRLNLDKAIPLAAKAGDSARVAEDYSNVALPFMDYGDYGKAVFYLNKSVALFRRIAPRDVRQADNFTRIAQVYTHQNILPVARIHLDSAQAIFKSHPHSIYVTNYYMVEGMYYICMQDWNHAEKNIDAGLAVAEQLKSRYDIRSLLYQKARLYDKKKDPAAVKRVLLKMLQEGYVEIDHDRKQMYRDLAYTESELGNMKEAYNWMLRYSDFADSFYEKDTKLKIADLETRYNYTQKEKELIIATAKVKTQRMVLLASFLLTAITTVFFIFLYRLRKAKAEQEVQSLKQQQQIALTQALLAGEEKERTRMARDLHDGLGGMLAGVKINLTNILQEHASSDIDRVIGQLDNSVTELRRIARNMMPEALLRSGLQTALADFCQSAASNQLHIDFRFMNISGDIPMQVQIIIYRIVQELLTNIVKHSGASDAFVQCTQDGHVFFITVEDNGLGFPQSDSRLPKGLGIDSIRSRVDFLAGKMDITGGSGKGTIVNIELQINEER